MATNRADEALDCHALALRMFPENEEYRIKFSMAQEEASAKQMGPLPAADWHPTGGDVYDRISERAILMSRQRRGEDVPISLGAPFPSHEPGQPQNSIYRPLGTP